VPSKTKTPTAAEAPAVAFLAAAQLRARYGNVSHMWIERLLKRDASFPRPTTFGGSILRFWRLDEVEAWERTSATKKGEAA
jgi:hypothetical protein